MGVKPLRCCVFAKSDICLLESCEDSDGDRELSAAVVVVVVVVVVVLVVVL